MTTPAQPQTAQQDAAAQAAIEQYRLEQVALASAFLAQFVPMWNLLSWTGIDATADAWVSAVTAMIRQWRQVSAELAERFYGEHRLLRRPQLDPMPAIDYVHAPADVTQLLRDVTGRNTRDRAGELISLDAAVRRAAARARSNAARQTRNRPRIDWAEHDRAAEVAMRVTGPINLKRQAQMGRDERQARDTALVQASGAGVRQVLNGGRFATLTLVEQDPATDRWVRVTDGDPCAFCAMLASRGAVYTSRESAGFQAHDHCACTAVPVFSSADVPQLNRDLQKLWNSQIQGQFSGEDAIKAWRRFYEGQRRLAARRDELSA